LIVVHLIFNFNCIEKRIIQDKTKKKAYEITDVSKASVVHKPLRKSVQLPTNCPEEVTSPYIKKKRPV
jgi:hypothetical protein